ncbi:MAG: YlmC/YmxH family sporulation protein [Clostridia bacterium]|nr:YlmC/YmxH family sporulation protein [Clostridia bacterium]
MINRSDRASDFRRKEVIDISDGKRLGYITDVEIDLEKGVVLSVIIPGKRRFFGLLPPTDDIVIEWRRISKIGDDIILVNAGYEGAPQSMPPL